MNEKEDELKKAGEEFQNQIPNLERKEKDTPLKKKVGTALFIASLVIGLGFMTPTVTGNTIAGMSLIATNSFGLVFFFFGIGGLYFMFRRK